MWNSSNHPPLTGSADIQSMEIPKGRGGNPWEFMSGLDNYRGSNDVNLFSSSLPVLRHEKLNYTDANHDSQVIEDASSNTQNLRKNVDANIAKDDLDTQCTGKLLPDDEDDLLAGIIDDFDLNGLPSQLEDLEDDDVFDSGGGLELDFDPIESISVAMARSGLIDGYVGNGGTAQYSIPNGVGAVAGEHPYGEHPSRTLFVRNINSNVEDSELRSLFEQYGDIRTLYTSCKHRGFVMISYYDIRDARNAMRALQNKPLRRRKLDIHFSIPKDNPSDKDINQGTLVVFNLDTSVMNDELRQIFGVYGEVKEIRETPHKRHHKFIEYYDVRAAEAALRALNRRDIAGKRIKLEHSRPGGARRNFIQQLSQEQDLDDTKNFRHQVGSPIVNSPPGTWGQFGSPGDVSPLQGLSQSPTLGANHIPGNNSPGLASIIPPLSNSIKIPPIGKDRGVFNYLNHHSFSGSNPTIGVPFQQSHSFPENGSGLLTNTNTTAGTVSSFGQSTAGASAVGSLTGPQYLWGSPTLYSEKPRSTAWPVPSHGHSFTPTGRGFPFSNHHNSFIPTSQSYHSHHVGSAPSGVPLDMRFGYFPESPDTSYLNSGTFGGASFGRNEGGLVNINARGAINPAVGISGNMPENALHGFRMIPPQRTGHLYINGGPYPGGPNGIDGLIDRGRNRRAESNGSQNDCKRQYQLELEKIISGEDNRTTLMIKNIPNKYTSKMFLTAIEENHKGTYDFLYLPIDFKNKCNVGYAFINMISTAHIIPFYEAFNGKKWEKFNSEKVASLAYARIQGKAALIAHFQNSSLMNEDKRCRPIIFHSEGPDAGDQEPFPPTNTNIHVPSCNGFSPGDVTENPKKISNDEIEKTNEPQQPGSSTGESSQITLEAN